MEGVELGHEAQDAVVRGAAMAGSDGDGRGIAAVIETSGQGRDEVLADLDRGIDSMLSAIRLTFRGHRMRCGRGLTPGRCRSGCPGSRHTGRTGIRFTRRLLGALSARWERAARRKRKGGTVHAYSVRRDATRHSPCAWSGFVNARIPRQSRRLPRTIRTRNQCGGAQVGGRLSMKACTPSSAASSIMLHAMVLPASS